MLSARGVMSSARNSEKWRAQSPFWCRGVRDVEKVGAGERA